MDLVYLSENFAFDSIRAPINDRYRGGWTDYESDHRSNNMKHTPAKAEKTGKQHCKLCQDKNKKTLSNYFRQKSCSGNDCITEEVAEE